jgi:DNA mismatch repair protein MutL
MVKEALTPKTLIPHIDDKPVYFNVYENDNLDVPSVSQKPKYEEFKLDFDSIVKEDTSNYILNEDLVEEDDIEIHEDVLEKLPVMYPVGLVHGTYIIAQNENGMYMIDQHAAKERINYEYFKEKLANPEPIVTDMLVPLTLEFTNTDFIILKENMDFLRSLGFVIEEFGINSVVIKGHPVWLLKSDVNTAINHIIELIIHQEKNFTLEKFNDHLAATVACKASIKANTDITFSEMENLINDLRKCSNPFNCPHGRPTTIYYSKYDLEKLFKRSGF